MGNKKTVGSPQCGTHLKKVLSEAYVRREEFVRKVMAEAPNCRAVRLWAHTLTLCNFPTWSAWHPKIRNLLEEGWKKRIADHNFVSSLVAVMDTCEAIWSSERAARLISWLAFSQVLVELGPELATVILSEEIGAPKHAKESSLGDPTDRASVAALDPKPESIIPNIHVPGMSIGGNNGAMNDLARQAAEFFANNPRRKNVSPKIPRLDKNNPSDEPESSTISGPFPKASLNEEEPGKEAGE